MTLTKEERGIYNVGYYQRNKERFKKYRQNNLEKIAAYDKKYRRDNKEKKLAYEKEYRQNNKEKICACKKKYRQVNGEKIKEYLLVNMKKITAYRKENKQKARDYNIVYNKLHPDVRRLNNKKYRQGLSDCYLKNLLIVQGRRYGWNAENITQELVDLKREQLFMYREINKLKKEVQNGTNRTRSQRA